VRSLEDQLEHGAERPALRDGPHPGNGSGVIVQSPFLTTRQAGAFLGLSPRTLETHRTTGTGPLYRKLGGRVVYAVTDLISWADRGVRQSTFEKPATKIEPTNRRRASGG